MLTWQDQSRRRHKQVISLAAAAALFPLQCCKTDPEMGKKCDGDYECSGDGGTCGKLGCHSWVCPLLGGRPGWTGCSGTAGGAVVPDNPHPEAAGSAGACTGPKQNLMA